MSDEPSPGLRAVQENVPALISATLGPEALDFIRAHPDNAMRLSAMLAAQGDAEVAASFRLAQSIEDAQYGHASIFPT